MHKLETGLKNAGYHTVNIDYPSTTASIETLSEQVIPAALSLCPPGSRKHFVTHSLGGILLRHYLSGHQVDMLGRVVMLAPPNKGNEAADWLQGYWLYQRIFGPVGAQLGTDAESLPNRLGPASFEVGIIAGTRAINLLLSPWLAKPNDGTVCVANTRLEGMADHLCLPVTHPFIMCNPTVIQQVLFFLQHGRFNHEGSHS